MKRAPVAKAGAQPSAQDENDAPWPVGLRIAHWLMALCVLGAAGLALYLVYPPEWSDRYIARYESGIVYHKLLGLSGLVAIVALMLQHRFRPARAGSLHERRGAALVQWALMSLVIIVASSGYIASSFYAGKLIFPGLASLNSPLPYNEALGGAVTILHDVGAYVLLAFAALHVLAGLRRQFLLKDYVIARMLGLARGDKEKPR